MYYALLSSLLVVMVSVTQAQEYIYPVEVVPMSSHSEPDIYNGLFLIHQESPDHLELLLWNPVTKVTTKGLLSTFTPAGFKILPDGKGFSFVDKGGRILVKSFSKRSPKSIQLYEPIKDIAIIDWIDARSFYFMGKEAQHYAVFQADLNGFVYPIIKNPKKDYMHPSKVDNQLFFIQRDGHNYSICQSHYPAIEDDTHLITDNDEYKRQVEALLNSTTQEKKASVQDEDIKVIIDLHDQSAAFLKMISPTEGLYVEYPQEILRNDKLVHFAYCHIFKTEQGWERKVLFNFSLPTHFFLTTNDFRLYESLLPLLPRYINGSLFFMSCDDEEELKTVVFRYDFNSCKMRRISQKTGNGPLGTSFFSPVKLNSMIFFGGTVSVDEEYEAHAHNLPSMWINDDGFVCVDLPFVFNS